MKSLKLLGATATACLLVGVSNAVIAQVNTCEDGSIWKAVVNEIEVHGRSCDIRDVLVHGNITTTGGQTISLTSSHVGGDVNISGADNAIVKDNILFAGVLRVNENGIAIIEDNITAKGSEHPEGVMEFKRNQNAIVRWNTAGRSIDCKNNKELEAIGNVANGENRCSP